ncbi:MAG: fructose PTS transporter subunit IIA [Sulfobacillus sp.]|mgnify:CR=1 FL=1|nr:fructose PTS transporter subunit IIA [Sulfobacillus sp.]
MAPFIVQWEIPATSRDQVITQLVSTAAAHGRVHAIEPVVQEVMAREQAGSTGFGQGFAIPHGKSDAVQEPTVLFARLASPVDWQALDGQPVQFVFLILVPNTGSQEHLRMLAILARKLMHPEFVQDIRQATSPEALEAVLHRELIQ